VTVGRRNIFGLGQIVTEAQDWRLRAPFSKDTDVFTTYCYVVNGKRLRVSRAANDALTPGVPYRVFYARLCRRVLALEPVEKAEEQPDAQATGQDQRRASDPLAAARRRELADGAIGAVSQYR
jgi:hypothetical protein